MDMKENNDELLELTRDDELLVEQFMAGQRHDVADHGFSRRVMRHLPGRAYRLNRLWTIFCCALGVAFFVSIRGWDVVMSTLRMLAKTLPAADIFFVSPVAMVLSMFAIMVSMVYGTMKMLERVQ
jgi:hypothetical protein